MSKFLKSSQHPRLSPEEAKELKNESRAVLDELFEPADMLRKLRVQKGLSQKELGEKIGVDPDVLIKMEDEDILIDEKTADKLGHLFQVDPDVFLV